MNLQRKRQVFREQIRRKQVQQLFSKRRQQFLSQQDSFKVPSQQVKEQIYHIIYQFVQRLQINNKNNEYSEISKDIDILNQQYDKKKSQMNYCLNQFFHKSGKEIIDMAKKKIPFEVLGDIQEQQILQQKRYSQQQFMQQITIILKLINLGSKLKLNRFSLESCILIVRVIQKVFKEKYHLPVEQFTQSHKISTQILYGIMQMLKNMLKNIKNREKIKQQLQKIGFNQQLTIIIKLSQQFPDYMHEQLINLLLYYVQSTNNQKQSKQEDNIYNQCHLIGTNHPHKQQQLIYCLYFIDIQKSQFYEQALTIIDQIFNTQCYLISQVEFKHLKKIANFILGGNRNSIIASLFIINTVVFYSVVSVDQLISQGQLLNIIQYRLIEQKNFCKPNRELVIQKCIYILQDILLTKTIKIKKIIRTHSIWQLLYNSISDAHPLLSTITVFEYYFQNIGRPQTLKIIPSFINAVSCLDLNSKMDYIKQIKKLIISLYVNSKQFWEEYDFQIIKNSIESNNLLFILQEQLQL